DFLHIRKHLDLCETNVMIRNVSAGLSNLVPSEIEDTDILASLTEVSDLQSEDLVKCLQALEDLDAFLKPIWEQQTPTATAVHSPSVEEPAIPEEDNESFEEAVDAASKTDHLERTTP